MKLRILIFIIFTTIINIKAQKSSNKIWNKKKCTVVLTYDDGLNVHLDKVIPELDSAGLKGTFYLPGLREGVKNMINDWRKAAENGHELGNHTLFHPCIAVMKNRDYSDWVPPEYDLNNYTITRIVDEIKMANIFLNAIDGKNKRTIAYPCGDFSIKDSSYIPQIKDELAGGRGGTTLFPNIDSIDLYMVAAVPINDNFTGSQLIDLVKEAMHKSSVIVFLFHGVGGEHNTNISHEKHSELICFLKENQSDIWVATMIELVEFIKKYQSNSDK